MHNVDVYKSLADGAYQGAPGAYSEEAAQLLLGKDARLMPCATLEQAFDAITDGRVTHAVVPVENAVSGTVPLVYELLLANDLVVAGETGDDRMTLRCEVNEGPAGLVEAIVASIRDVTKLRGDVELVAPGTLPNDGKVIDDTRKYS